VEQISSHSITTKAEMEKLEEEAYQKRLQEFEKLP